MKHTKGKWKYCSGLFRIVSDDGTVITELCGIGKDLKFNNEARANARLIASAPELLEACKKLNKAFACYDISIPPAYAHLINTELQQAINQAEPR